MRLALVGVILVCLFSAARANGTTVGGGGGGYQQLPTCGPAFYGVTLYVQGYLWRCVHANPDHWVIV